MGIITRIDMHDKIKEKLGLDFTGYVILGACNPSYAHRALLTEDNVGLLLPCNVVLYEKNDGIVISVIKPTMAMAMIENDELKRIAVEIESKLLKAFGSMQ